jgi:uncharacterized circularly permuted ATP-grasp superfamily protein
MDRNTTFSTTGYFSQQALLDECFGAAGEVKEHWKRLLSNVDRLSMPELKSRQQEVMKLLQENGVTYTVNRMVSTGPGNWTLFPCLSPEANGRWSSAE